MRLRSFKNITSIHERLEKLLTNRRVFWTSDHFRKILQIGEYYYVENFVFYSVKNGLLYMQVEYEDLSLNITKTGRMLHFKDTYKKFCIESLRIHEKMYTELFWWDQSDYHIAHRPYSTFNDLRISKGYWNGQRSITYNKC